MKRYQFGYASEANKKFVLIREANSAHLPRMAAVQIVICNVKLFFHRVQ